MQSLPLPWKLRDQITTRNKLGLQSLYDQKPKGVTQTYSRLMYKRNKLLTAKRLTPGGHFYQHSISSFIGEPVLTVKRSHEQSTIINDLVVQTILFTIMILPSVMIIKLILPLPVKCLCFFFFILKSLHHIETRGPILTVASSSTSLDYTEQPSECFSRCSYFFYQY